MRSRERRGEKRHRDENRRPQSQDAKLLYANPESINFPRVQRWRFILLASFATVAFAGSANWASAQTPTPTVTVTPTATPTATASGSPTPTPSITPSPSATPTASITPSPSTTPTPSATPKPSITPTPNPSATPSPTPSGEALLNISTRARDQTGDNVLIGGFILGNGTSSKSILLRALGPSLAARGVASPLSDPSLTLFDSSGGVIASNDDWMTNSNQQDIINTGLAPADPREAAILTTLGPGSYTAVVFGGIDGTSNNIALVEVYDLNSIVAPDLLNISTRGFVGTSDGVMIAGVIAGGLTTKTVVVRGIGPSLAGVISNPLPNPTLTIYNGFGTAVGANDDWQNDPGAGDISALGLAPGNTLEAATELFLVPGAYTAILSDANANSGTGLVEVYNVSP